MHNPLDKALKQALQKAMSRRDFLRLSGAGLGFAAIAGSLSACGDGNKSNNNGGSEDPGDTDPITDSPLPPASAEYSVLKHTSFGVHRDSLALINDLGIDAFLEYQLDYQSIDDNNLEADLQALFPLVFQTADELIEGFPDNIYNIALQMSAATQYRQIFSQRQLYEVMVEFWSDHFNIHLVNGLGPTLKPQDDLNVIRQHALGNFKDLLAASAHSPAMLFYLDNFYNLSTAPNENYARELMELHTLGVDGGYTETDIKEVARCFTGWTLNFPDDAPAEYGTFSYEPFYHDDEAKLVLNQTISAGGGKSDAEQVLDILASHSSTAEFIATKLCRRFISDNPDQASIDEVANAFVESAGEIKDTLRALFATDEFRNTADSKITRPSEFLAGLIRALAPDTAYPTDAGQILFFAQSLLGQIPFYWPTPDGYPDTQDYWGSTGGMLNRWRLSFFSYATYIPEINVIQIDYATMLQGANTLATILDALVEQLLMRPLSDQDRQTILGWLSNEYSISESTEIPSGVPEQVAALMSAVLLSSAYFQLR